MVQHEGVANLTHALIDLFDLGPESRVLQFASFGFDASVTEFFPTFAVGGTLCITPQEVLSSGPDLLDLFQKENVSVGTFPPSLLSMLPADVQSLRTIVSAGEPCSWEIVSNWAPSRRFLNGYGPTEVTVAASYYPAQEDQSKETKGVPIGRPICNVSCHVLDGLLRPVPVGVAGELFIGGVGVARGYLKRPDWTAERFIPDPFQMVQGPGSKVQGHSPSRQWEVQQSSSPIGAVGGQSGKRLYRSGDLARYLPDGNLEFLGRIDHQVKIRGFRIELGEIEAALCGHGAVGQAVVTSREDDHGEKYLAAYVVPRGELRPEVLRGYLEERLPAYMVPGVFVILDALPLTPGGKVDRRALPPPEGARAGWRAPYASPRTPVEAMLCELWAQVLGVERVGIRDNFYDLGGHSLKATQLVSRIQRLFEVDLRIKDLLETLTVAGLAERVEARRKEPSGLKTAPIEKAARDADLPLSFSQQRLWFLDQLAPGRHLLQHPPGGADEGEAGGIGPGGLPQRDRQTPRSAPHHLFRSQGKTRAGDRARAEGGACSGGSLRGRWRSKGRGDHHRGGAEDPLIFRGGRF